MDSVECVVIGAGIVGLAVARALARAGREVVVLEAEDAIGTHTSSRNSEVIHAGIYYPKGSLKARACVSGRKLLYDYCASHGVPHRRCGKLIVATDASADARAARHPARKRTRTASRTWSRSPPPRRCAWNRRCIASPPCIRPSTGIVDSHALMLAYQGDARGRGRHAGA